MKKKIINNLRILLLVVSLIILQERIIAQEDSAKPQPVVKLHYYNKNNSMQYLILESMLKNGKILTPQKDKIYEIYLGNADENLISKVKTDINGKAKAFIPLSLKSNWDASSEHKFIVKEGEEEVTEYVITKSKVTLDTASSDGVRNITVSVMKLEDSNWLPAADVEIKVGVSRFGGTLSAGDDDTYTTDSGGTVTVEFNKNDLPGDSNGKIMLIALIENNDEFGNVSVEKNVAWGIAQTDDSKFFDQRTLWSTRSRTPFWLLLLAYSIIIGVWSTLVYLVVQLIKIRSLGTEISATKL